MNLSNIPQNERWNVIQSLLNDNFSRISTAVDRSMLTSKTFYSDWGKVNIDYPNPQEGDKVFFGSTYPGTIWEYRNGGWNDTGVTVTTADVNLADYVLRSEVGKAPVYLTQQEYDSLVASGQIDNEVEYNIYEE